MKPKYLMTNLVYGHMYASLFVQDHLKSLLDETNIPDLADKYDIEYVIFTDDETAGALANHPSIKKLNEYAKVRLSKFDGEGTFDGRYSLLVAMFKESVQKALAMDSLLSVFVADLVFAKDFFSKVTSKIEQGHGAVFVLPLRSSAEAMRPHLESYEGALPALKLCRLGYENLHPLWVACHWDNPQFTKLPFTLLWNTGSGLLARSYSTTPIIFKPKKEMLEGRGMIDGDIPQMCDNPFWANDWIDAPVIGVEPLFCYYPPFTNQKASVETVKEWTKLLEPSQLPLLKQKLYYPSKEIVGNAQDEASDKVVDAIC